MNYKQLGKADLHISQIGFGCMSLKGNQDENEKIIHRAIELGVNYFDTADLYNKGMNETSVGKALKDRRDKVVLATKVGNQWREDGSGWDWNPRKDYILKCAEGSLKRLQTDVIDLYQLHGGTMEDPIDETIEAFELLKQQGKIRYYGISSIRPNVIREYIERSNIVSVMMQYSLLDRRPEEICLPLLQTNNIAVLARGTVAQGLLVNKPAKPYLNYTEDQVAHAATAVASLSGEQRTAAQTTLQFVLDNPAITSTIVGIRTMKQLEDAVKTLSAPKLTPHEIDFLRQAVRPNFYEQHR
jgi:aryl-alcohol dehydrogenase-like predicted oxidoreductase